MTKKKTIVGVTASICAVALIGALALSQYKKKEVLYVLAPQTENILAQSAALYVGDLQIIPEERTYTEQEKNDAYVALLKRSKSAKKEDLMFPTFTYSFNGPNSSLDKVIRSLANSSSILNQKLFEASQKRLESSMPTIYYLADTTAPKQIISGEEAKALGQAMIDVKVLPFAASRRNYNFAAVAKGLCISEDELAQRINDYLRIYRHGEIISQRTRTSNQIPDIRQTLDLLLRSYRP